MGASKEGYGLAIVTISRQMMSFGDEIAVAVAQKMGYALVSHETLPGLLPGLSAHERHMLTESARFFLTQDASGETYISRLTAALREFTARNSAVLVGFGSQAAFADTREALHVRVIAPLSVRTARLKRQYHVTDEQAGSILVQAEKKQKKFVSTIFGEDLADPAHYHITLNTAELSADECAAAVIAALGERELALRIERQAGETSAQSNVSDLPLLKNQAEIDFARLLDMYHIDWKYEPKTFPVEWDAQGNVKSAFSPDFYLTKFDTYIELTTMNQKYVTEKNKKVKKLRELYPGTRIKVVYKKDFRSLVERFKLNGEQ
jgi:Cytidylate kinase